MLGLQRSYNSGPLSRVETSCYQRHQGLQACRGPFPPFCFSFSPPFPRLPLRSCSTINHFSKFITCSTKPEPRNFAYFKCGSVEDPSPLGSTTAFSYP